MKNLFQDREDAGSIIVQAPNAALLESIYQYNDRIDSVQKNTKRFALLFVILMAILWIGGDLGGMPSDLVLLFGLLTIFGFPLVWLIGWIWVSRPSLKRRSEEMAMQAGSDMHVPDDAVEIEMLFPRKITEDLFEQKEPRFDNRLHLVYADNEAFYFVDVTGTARISYSLMEPWREAAHKAMIRQWIRKEKPSDYAKDDVIKKGRLLSLLPIVGSFFPDRYLVSYQYTILHTNTVDYLICIPAYEMEKLKTL